MKTHSLVLWLLVSLALASGVCAEPRDWYVATNGSDAAGTAWDNAYTNRV